MNLHTFKNTADNTLKGKMIRGLAQYNHGSVSHAVRSVTGNGAAGDTFTVGSDTYELLQITTDAVDGSAVSIVAASDVSATQTNIRFATAPAPAFVEGDVFAVGTEFFVVLKAADATNVTVLRGAFGTTPAATVAASFDVKRASTAKTAGNLAVPFTAPTSGFVRLNVQRALEFWVAGYNDSVGGGRGVYVEAATKVGVQLLGSNDIVLTSAGSAGLVNSEAASNMTITNFSVEQEVASAHASEVPYTVTAADVTAGAVNIALPFAPRAAEAKVFEDDGTVVAWDGAVSFEGSVVTVDNGGATDFSATDVIILKAYK